MALVQGYPFPSSSCDNYGYIVGDNYWGLTLETVSISAFTESYEGGEVRYLPSEAVLVDAVRCDLVKTVGGCVVGVEEMKSFCDPVSPATSIARYIPAYVHRLSWFLNPKLYS